MTPIFFTRLPAAALSHGRRFWAQLARQTTAPSASESPSNTVHYSPSHGAPFNKWRAPPSALMIMLPRRRRAEPSQLFCNSGGQKKMEKRRSDPSVTARRPSWQQARRAVDAFGALPRPVWQACLRPSARPALGITRDISSPRQSAYIAGLWPRTPAACSGLTTERPAGLPMQRVRMNPSSNPRSTPADSHPATNALRTGPTSTAAGRGNEARGGKECHRHESRATRLGVAYRSTIGESA